MATISHNDLAPDEKVHYALGGVEFDVEGDGTYETNDNDVIANARAHPWLKVEVPVAEQLGGFYGAEHLAPEDDVLSGVNSIANDPEAVQAELERRFSDQVAARLAVDAGLDQSSVEFEGEGSRRVAETLAAHEEVKAEQPAETVEEQPAGEPEGKPAPRQRRVVETQPAQPTPDAAPQE